MSPLANHRDDGDSEDHPEENLGEEVDTDSVEDPEDIMDQEPEEDSDVEIYEESDEDPEDEMDKDPEEDLEEEFCEEYDQDSGDVINVECEEISEKEMDEEPEYPEEETLEDLEDVSGKGKDLESDKQKLVVENSDLSSRNHSSDIKDLVHKFHEVIDEERGNKVIVNKSEPISRAVSLPESHHSINMIKHAEDKTHYVLKENVLNPSSKVDDQFEDAKFKSVTQEACKSLEKFSECEKLESDTCALRKFDGEIGHPKVIADGDCAFAQQEPSRSSRKYRHSRWDLRQEEATPLTDGTNKRRKTRWDNNDSRSFLFQSLDFLNSIELLMDPEVIRLKKILVDINTKLQSSENYGKRLVEETSPPKPDSQNHGIKLTRRNRKKLEKRRQKILSELSKQLFKTPAKFVKKIFIPVEEYPNYNFVGLILGPRGSTVKKMEKETGAKILLRGKDSGTPDQDEDLHVLVETNSQLSLNTAVSMIEKLLIPIDDQNNDHKRAQLAELAKLRGTYIEHNTCSLCKEQGHKQYACPLKDTTFRTVCCDLCGSFDHPTSKCKSKDGSKNEEDNATLYVGYLSQATDEKRLKELFLPFGRIIKTSVIKDQSTGVSKGYGFVKFDNPSDADAAVKYMNGHKMDGKILAVRVAGKKPLPGPSLMTVPSIMYGQTSCIFNPVPVIFPEAQVSGSSWDSQCFPHSSGYVTRTMGLAIPPYDVSSTTNSRMSGNCFAGGNFANQIPSSIPGTITQFPGNPDYPCSQFQSYFTGPVMSEFQASQSSLMPEIIEKPFFWASFSISLTIRSTKCIPCTGLSFSTDVN